ncbi:MAG TPA: Hpt domain-containing protein, partial [Cellvibrionaceae bacterium]|nr:Hpt domain-containing protein [Cellvibrionaceae bacterium]
LEEVLVSFADKAAHIIPELQQAIQNQEHEAATRILHKLKGTSANLSAVRVAPLAARLETQCKQGQLPSDAEVAELALAITQLITTAAHLTQAALTPQASATPVNQQAIKQCLERIDTHLNSDLGQAEDAVETLLHLCNNTSWHDSAQQLRTVFYQFNLRAVRELILNGFE